MSDAPTDLNTQLHAQQERIAALNTQLEQVSEKIESMLAETEKIKNEILQATQNLHDTIHQQQGISLQKIDAELNQAKQQMTNELAEAKKNFSTQLATAKNTFDTELTEWQTQSSALLHNAEADFSSQKNEQERTYTELHEKITSLLPEASAVGISKAFADEKNARKNVMIWNLGISYACIISIFIVASWYYKSNENIFSAIFSTSTEKTDYFTYVVSFAKLLTLEVPLCWLATFAAKKAHQHQRIYEEYSHKYAAAMTYAGLCKETRDNPELYGKDAVKNLADGFRDAVFFNPSAEIDNKVESDNPLEQASKLLKSVGQPAAEALIGKKSQS